MIEMEKNRNNQNKDHVIYIVIQ